MLSDHKETLSAQEVGITPELEQKLTDLIRATLATKCSWKSSAYLGDTSPPCKATRGTPNHQLLTNKNCFDLILSSNYLTLREISFVGRLNHLQLAWTWNDYQSVFKQFKTLEIGPHVFVLSLSLPTLHRWSKSLYLQQALRHLKHKFDEDLTLAEKAEMPIRENLINKLTTSFRSREFHCGLCKEKMSVNYLLEREYKKVVDIIQMACDECEQTKLWTADEAQKFWGFHSTDLEHIACWRLPNDDYYTTADLLESWSKNMILDEKISTYPRYQDLPLLLKFSYDYQTKKMIDPSVYDWLFNFFKTTTTATQFDPTKLDSGEIISLLLKQAEEKKELKALFAQHNFLIDVMSAKNMIDKVEFLLSHDAKSNIVVKVHERKIIKESKDKFDDYSDPSFEQLIQQSGYAVRTETAFTLLLKYFFNWAAEQIPAQCIPHGFAFKLTEISDKFRKCFNSMCLQEVEDANVYLKLLDDKQYHELYEKLYELLVKMQAKYNLKTFYSEDLKAKLLTAYDTQVSQSVHPFLPPFWLAAESSFVDLRTLCTQRKLSFKALTKSENKNLVFANEDLKKIIFDFITPSRRENCFSAVLRNNFKIAVDSDIKHEQVPLYTGAALTSFGIDSKQIMPLSLKSFSDRHYDLSEELDANWHHIKQQTRFVFFTLSSEIIAHAVGVVIDTQEKEIDLLDPKALDYTSDTLTRLTNLRQANPKFADYTIKVSNEKSVWQFSDMGFDGSVTLSTFLMIASILKRLNVPGAEFLYVDLQSARGLRTTKDPRIIRCGLFYAANSNAVEEQAQQDSKLTTGAPRGS